MGLLGTNPDTQGFGAQSFRTTTKRQDLPIKPDQSDKRGLTTDTKMAS